MNDWWIRLRKCVAVLSFWGFILSGNIVTSLQESPNTNAVIPVEVVQAWQDAERAYLDEVDRGFAWHVERGAPNKPIEELIVKRIGAKRLVEVVRAEYAPGVISSGLAVFGPDGGFSLSKSESGGWLYVGSDNAKEQTMSVEMLNSSIGYRIDGQSLMDFFDSCSNVTVSTNAESGPKLVISYQRNIGGSPNGIKRTVCNGQCEFDPAQGWRMVKHERTSIADLGERGRDEFGTEKHEQSGKWIWTFVGSDKIRLDLTTTSNLVGSSEHVEVLDRLPQPTENEFTLDFYGLKGIVANESRPFWRNTTFWMTTIGILFISMSVYLRFRGRKE